MFGLFGRKPKPTTAHSSRLPDKLVFKDNQSAFEYFCKFCSTDIVRKSAISAIILDPRQETAAFQVMREQFDKGNNIYRTFLVKVASRDGGFNTLGLCYKKDARLGPGDLVYWVPMDYNPAYAMFVPDKRAAHVARNCREAESQLYSFGWY